MQHVIYAMRFSGQAKPVGEAGAVRGNLPRPAR